MTLKEIKKIFGLNPEEIGLRYRDYQIVDTDDPWESIAKKGYLAVCARDGASNEPDCTVGKHPNYVGTFSDDYDCTYRYYIFKPLNKEKIK